VPEVCCGQKFPPRHFLTVGDRLIHSFHAHQLDMADEELNLYDEIEIEDCFYDETLQIYHHPCPCGDRFEISIYDMRDGEDIARCPSCSLMIRIIFDAV
jgi:diphthamide biosynthesis protein 3